ncbi:MAG: hypothetical protein R3C26_19120 [Calditrichia bacterium]
MGKSIVIAKDTPNFIANRVGVYATMQAMRYFTDGNYSIEEIDALTGRSLDTRNLQRSVERMSSVWTR